eukprot:GHVP01035874.1.p1 GENE.GHVP01035874.1~~GHVP01035874.1.p1  ORF type:complete len:128 (-),score=13.60 GHVP01035874.1:99-482(-)
MELDLNHNGTIWYMPPEHLEAALNRKISKIDGRFDVWSLGIILHELVMGYRPFGNRAFAAAALKDLTYDHAAALVLWEFRNLKGLEIPALTSSQYSNDLKNFIMTCLSTIDTRPQARELKLHPWIKS